MVLTGGTALIEVQRGRRLSVIMDHVQPEDAKNADGLTTRRHAAESALHMDLCRPARTTQMIAKLATSVWRQV